MSKRAGNEIQDGEAKYHKPEHAASQPGAKTPSGRMLRNVAGWESSSIPVSTNSDSAAQLLDMAAEEIVSVAGEATTTAKLSAESDTGWALPTCVVLWLQYIGNSAKGKDPVVEELVKEARNRLAKRKHSLWEQAFGRAMIVMSDGKLDQCIMGVEEAMELSPCCAMLLKIHQDLCFFVGAQQRMRDGIARSLPLLDASTTPMFGFVLGMYAFALAECEQTVLGEQMARRAIAIYNKDVWALHAMAHLLEERNQCGEVVAFATSTQEQWKHSNLCCHMHFHLGVARLDQGGDETALDHYDREIAPFVGRLGTFALVDASQMLTRISLEGVHVGDRSPRWARVVELWFAHVGDHRLAFNDAHIALAAAGSGDPARFVAARASMEAFLAESAAAPPQDRVHITTPDVLARIGLPILRGTDAFGRGKYDEAVKELAPVRYAWKSMGGSNVQRAVFWLVLFHAAVRSKSHKAFALQLLNQADSAGVSETSKRFRPQLEKALNDAAVA